MQNVGHLASGNLIAHTNIEEFEIQDYITVDF